MGDLKNKTVVITGGSRGIGKAIAIKASKDGANVVILAKTETPHPKLPGTIYDTAKEVEAAGGKALALPVDIRDETQVFAAIDQTIKTFGGIDVLVNNASAISLTSTMDTPIKRYDLMHDVNARGTFLCSQACLPYLLKSSRPHILTLSPPLNFRPEWFGPHVAYSMSKYAMSMCVYGLAQEYRSAGIGVNALWPRTTIATAAVQNIVGGDEMIRRSRKPEIMADAAYLIITADPRKTTGRFFTDEEVLRKQGVTNFDNYAVTPGATLQTDLFVGESSGSDD